MSNVALKCQCGAVTGTVNNVAPSTGSRVVCCCSDCQDFAEYLGQQDAVLDTFGGTEIYQTGQSHVTIEQGAEHLACMRLKEKGLLRWYTSCCNTAIGNTINAGFPFVGVIHTFIDADNRDQTLGPVKAYVQTQHAIGEPDYPNHSAKFPLGVTLSIVGKMLLWKIQGKSKPSVFFDKDGRAVVKPLIKGAEVQ